MNAKAFLILLVLAALAAAGAYFIAFRPAATPPGAPAAPGSATSSATDARLAPALAERADDIASITITSASAGDADPVVLTRDPDRENDRWLLTNKANFPAEPDRVRRLITTLSELRTVEPKTAKPELHDRLAVQWPVENDSNENQSDFGPTPTLVTVADAEGEPIAQVVLGDTDYAAGGPRQYARLLDDNQTWLTNNTVNIPRGPLGFANTRFVELPRDSVQSVTITHVGGETLQLTRDDPEADFTVANLPEGATMKNQALANNTGNALAFVNFTDIEELTDENDRIRIPLNAPPDVFLVDNQVSATFLTFDDEYYYLVIDEIRENGDVIGGWVRTVAQGEGTDDAYEKFGDRRVKLPAGTIESLTRKPSELIDTPATDDTDPSSGDTPGLPPPTDD